MCEREADFTHIAYEGDLEGNSAIKLLMQASKLQFINILKVEEQVKHAKQQNHGFFSKDSMRKLFADKRQALFFQNCLVSILQDDTISSEAKVAFANGIRHEVDKLHSSNAKAPGLTG